MPDCPFECYTNGKDVNKHIEEAHFEAKYHCTFVGCGRSFKKESYLKTHSNVHNGVKPFSCLLCDKSFYHKNDLQRHELIHSGEKPFQCGFCCKSFTLKGNMDKHLKSQHLNDNGMQLQM